MSCCTTIKKRLHNYALRYAALYQHMSHDTIVDHLKSLFDTLLHCTSLQYTVVWHTILHDHIPSYAVEYCTNHQHTICMCGARTSAMPK